MPEKPIPSRSQTVRKYARLIARAPNQQTREWWESVRDTCVATDELTRALRRARKHRTQQRN